MKLADFLICLPAHESVFVESWTVWVSNDGKTGKKLADGEFGNIKRRPKNLLK